MAILNFWQAQELARKGMVKRAHKAAGKGGSFTVADAMAAYLEFLEANRKSAADARYRVDAHILPTLGGTEVGSLTTDQLRRWLADLAKAPARLRTRKGKAQQHRPAAQDDEERRRRRSTANRTLTVFKAALNHAWHDGHTPSDAAWRRVKPFEGADAAKVRYLAVTEATRLINSSAPVQFRNLVQGALQTGARYGELARLVVSDFNPDSDTVAIRQSKGGKPRHVVLTDEGAAFFAQLCAGRAGHDSMFQTAAGEPWKKSHQNRPMADACERAKISPPIGFHGLRHTYASLAVMNGAPLLVLAKNLGHTDTRMVERHYGHLAPSYIADAIRAAVPRFGAIEETNLTPISALEWRKKSAATAQ